MGDVIQLKEIDGVSTDALRRVLVAKLQELQGEIAEMHKQGHRRVKLEISIKIIGL